MKNGGDDGTRTRAASAVSWAQGTVGAPSFLALHFRIPSSRLFRAGEFTDYPEPLRYLA